MSTAASYSTHPTTANAAGFVIHSHMACRDVDCVAHTQTVAGMAVSAMECGLLPVAQTCMRFLHVAYHDFEGIADNPEERERLIAHLGDHEAMALRNHGLLVVSKTIAAAFNVLFRMERACQVQVAPIQWAVIVVLTMLILVTIAMIHIDNRTAMAATLLIFSTAVALCIVLLMVYDWPFSFGGVTMAPTTFREVALE